MLQNAFNYIENALQNPHR